MSPQGKYVARQRFEIWSAATPKWKIISISICLASISPCNGLEDSNTTWASKLLFKTSWASPFNFHVYVSPLRKPWARLRERRESIVVEVAPPPSQGRSLPAHQPLFALASAISQLPISHSTDQPTFPTRHSSPIFLKNWKVPTLDENFFFNFNVFLVHHFHWLVWSNHCRIDQHF